MFSMLLPFIILNISSRPVSASIIYFPLPKIKIINPMESIINKDVKSLYDEYRAYNKMQE